MSNDDSTAVQFTHTHQANFPTQSLGGTLQRIISLSLTKEEAKKDERYRCDMICIHHVLDAESEAEQQILELKAKAVHETTAMTPGMKLGGKEKRCKINRDKQRRIQTGDLAAHAKEMHDLRMRQQRDESALSR